MPMTGVPKNCIEVLGRPFLTFVESTPPARCRRAFVLTVMIDSNPYSPPSPQIDSALPYGVLAEAKKVTWWPGVLMIVQGAILSSVFAIAIAVDVYSRGLPNLASPQNIVMFTFLLAPLLLWCGIQLKRIESRGLCYLGAALSVVLFLPLGWAICIWAIVALNRPVVREAFRVRTLTQ
jgi:hypothetical protein